MPSDINESLDVVLFLLDRFHDVLDSSVEGSWSHIISLEAIDKANEFLVKSGRFPMTHERWIEMHTGLLQRVTNNA